MESYKLLAFVHVAAVVVGLGTTFAFPFLQAAAERSGVAATRFMYEAARRVENIVILPATIIIFVMGLGLIFDDNLPYKDDFPAWLMIAIPWYVATGLVWWFVQRKFADRALNTLRGVPDNAPLPSAYFEFGKKVQMVGGILGVSIIGILFLMVWKPGQ
ncbi:MAG: DUF2269 family protein [Dehalococcoidia bacterium]|nr:DUF2269 family protein [Dehalococcoidia bacterium]